VVAVKFDDISLAFDFVSSAAPMEHGAYISLERGQIFWMSEFTSMDEEVPDDLETSDRYVAIPHKNDLNLGRDLAFRFVAEYLPNRYGDVRACFRSKGAYSQFKQLLRDEAMLDKWYSFEAAAVEKAILEWCEQNGIEIIE
jgi:hypothetical protein